MLSQKRLKSLNKSALHISKASNQLLSKSTETSEDMSKFISKSEQEISYMLNYVHKWPLCVHFLAAFFCLFCSSVYHLFFVKDEFWRVKLAQLDYGGIIILILGSTYPLVWYSFAC